MVKRLLNSLFSSHSKIGLIEPQQATTLRLPEHPDTPIDLIRTNRKKTIAFRVANNRIKITAPKRLALYRIQHLLHKRSEWIGRQLEYQASIPEELPRQYFSGEPIRYLGEEYSLELATASGRSHTIELKSDSLMVALTARQQAHAQRQQKLITLLGAWYKQRATEYLPELVAHLASSIGVHYGPIEIRHFKSRWGSCRADGRLQFNWRIMMAPAQIIEYVAIHELCHRIHLNHSAAFWSEVARHMPEFKQHRKWLKENGHLLTL
jgi:predicted metal-dependent hydrolase